MAARDPKAEEARDEAARDDSPASGRHRLDVWLWHARCVRTRSSAAALVKAGRVRLNGARVTAASQPVRVGDVLTISLDSRVRLWRVTGFIERRGDAGAAATTYVEVAGPDAPDHAL